MRKDTNTELNQMLELSETDLKAIKIKGLLTSNFESF